jgi:hypothetical protein
MTKQDGIKIREARRARVRLIRARVIGGSVALFVAVWSLIAVVLVTGHDPALAHKTATTSTAATTTSADTGSTDPTSSDANSSSTSSGSSGATSSSTGSGNSGGVSGVTSSQS